MNIKTVFLTIILSILIGVGIVYITSTKNPGVQNIVKTATQNFSSPLPTESPKPSLAPLPENANLLEETEKLTPKDYQEEFKKLKDSL